MEEQKLPSRWRGIQLRTTYMAIVAPTTYLFVIFLMQERTSSPLVSPSMALVMGFSVLGMAVPALTTAFLTRGMISQARKYKGSEDGIAMIYDRMVLVRSTLFEAPLVLGLLWFMITRETGLVIAFFIFGTYFSIRKWPRKREYFDFLLEAQAP